MMPVRTFACLTLTLLLVIFFTGCKKLVDGDDHPMLPAYTETGANTFGCKVNDKVMIPQGSIYGSYQILKHSFYTTNDTVVFSIAAGDFIHNEHIYLSVRNLPHNKDTVIRIGSADSAMAWAMYTNRDYEQFASKSALTGELAIKKYNDTSGIIAGTFWFDAVDTTGKVVHVTEGRFDLK